jgi:hypothetical protein
MCMKSSATPGRKKSACTGPNLNILALILSESREKFGREDRKRRLGVRAREGYSAINERRQ